VLIWHATEGSDVRTPPRDCHADQVPEFHTSYQRAPSVPLVKKKKLPLLSQHKADAPASVQPARAGALAFALLPCVALTRGGIGAAGPCVDVTLVGFAVTATVVTVSAINIIINRATIFRFTLSISIEAAAPNATVL
jgi:hypothetical protein